MKNSHQLACHFTVVLVKVFFAHNQTLSWFSTETSWRLVSAVKTFLKNKAIYVCVCSIGLCSADLFTSEKLQSRFSSHLITLPVAAA